MPTHDMFEFKKPKTSDNLQISSIPQERLADYIGLTKYVVEVLGLNQEDLLIIAASLIDQQQFFSIVSNINISHELDYILKPT